MTERTRVGHYDIVSELGRGGMGVVYKGHESSLQRFVAIKMLSESLAGDASVVERFFREARSMAQLNDPHIVQIYFVGEDAGQPYFAMEFVEGESLSARLKREGRLEPGEAARILLQVAQGLATAHDRGVIHRDIKPANLLLTQRGLVKVADFGIAIASQDFNRKLTGTGQFVGTPGYLSPEVCLGKPVDQRSDIFALGIVFFEMLTGQSPFKDESPLGMMLEVVQAELPDVRAVNQAIDPKLAEILRHMVAKDPADRYPDCHALIEDLVAAGVHSAITVGQPRPPVPAAVGTVLNTPTPAELRRPSLAPVPAPAAGVASAAPPPAPPAAGPAPIQSRRRTGALEWGFAAALLVASIGVSAWWMRAPEPAGEAPVQALATTTAPATATPAPVAPTATPAADSAAGASADALPVDTAATQASASAPMQAAATAGPASAAMAPTLPAEAIPPATAVLAETPAAARTAVAKAADAVEAPAPSVAPAVARHESPEPRPRVLASADPPERPAAYRGPPRVIVLAIGDPAVAAVVESEIESRLDASRMVLVDEELVPGLGAMESRQAELPRLLAAARRHAEILVVARVVPLGQQELTFYGQSSTQYSARIDIGAYDTAASRKLGPGWNADLSFTNLNARQNTVDAIAPLLGRIDDALARRGRG